VAHVGGRSRIARSRRTHRVERLAPPQHVARCHLALALGHDPVLDADALAAEWIGPARKVQWSVRSCWLLVRQSSMDRLDRRVCPGSYGRAPGSTLESRRAERPVAAGGQTREDPGVKREVRLAGDRKGPVAGTRKHPGGHSKPPSSGSRFEAEER
jgi:hypothetical protein